MFIYRCLKPLDNSTAMKAVEEQLPEIKVQNTDYGIHLPG